MVHEWHIHELCWYFPTALPSTFCPSSHNRWRRCSATPSPPSWTSYCRCRRPQRTLVSGVWCSPRFTPWENVAQHDPSPWTRWAVLVSLPLSLPCVADGRYASSCGMSPWMVSFRSFASSPIPDFPCCICDTSRTSLSSKYTCEFPFLELFAPLFFVFIDIIFFDFYLYCTEACVHSLNTLRKAWGARPKYFLCQHILYVTPQLINPLIYQWNTRSLVLGYCLTGLIIWATSKIDLNCFSRLFFAELRFFAKWTPFLECEWFLFSSFAMVFGRFMIVWLFVFLHSQSVAGRGFHLGSLTRVKPGSQKSTPCFGEPKTTNFGFSPGMTQKMVKIETQRGEVPPADQ